MVPMMAGWEKELKGVHVVLQGQCWDEVHSLGGQERMGSSKKLKWRVGSRPPTPLPFG